MSKPQPDKILRLLQIFSAKLVLEVFGGAGAIWGFSEAIGLRVSSTIWFWRPCALTVGAIFFVRWISQIQDYVTEENIHVFMSKKSATSGVDGVDEEQVALASENGKVYSWPNFMQNKKKCCVHQMIESLLLSTQALEKQAINIGASAIVIGGVWWGGLTWLNKLSLCEDDEIGWN